MIEQRVNAVLENAAATSFVLRALWRVDEDRRLLVTSAVLQQDELSLNPILLCARKVG